LVSPAQQAVGAEKSPLGEDIREGKDAMMQSNPWRQMSLCKRELKSRLEQRETAEQQNDLDY